ncbi:hypothetical protein GCM10010182_31550 [Actinomadura cremea]|nr:hypothetical protein GCM10010182_31550 [Actinomadura cremea]
MHSSAFTGPSGAADAMFSRTDPTIAASTSTAAPAPTTNTHGEVLARAGGGVGPGYAPPGGGGPGGPGGWGGVPDPYMASSIGIDHEGVEHIAPARHALADPTPAAHADR